MLDAELAGAAEEEAGNVKPPVIAGAMPGETAELLASGILKLKEAGTA